LSSSQVFKLSCVWKHGGHNSHQQSPTLLYIISPCGLWTSQVETVQTTVQTCANNLSGGCRPFRINNYVAAVAFAAFT
jgi:hypothetical protein